MKFFNLMILSFLLSPIPTFAQEDAPSSDQSCVETLFTPFYFCTSDTEYTFGTIEGEIRFEKSSWEKALYNYVMKYLQTNELTEVYSDFTVKMFVSISDQGLSALRFEVRSVSQTDAARLLFSNGYTPELWDYSDVAIIDPKDGVYPENFGYAEKSIFGLVKKGVSLEDIIDLVDPLGAQVKVCRLTGSLPRCLFETKLLQEKQVVLGIQQADVDDLFLDITVNGFAEWNGFRFLYLEWTP
ncbi:MAG: hypothetical protein HRU19_28200 [Pseudobacteriovorax sp.]|nr:hypothetical protein [Pseudobacteriovorax sp.]